MLLTPRIARSGTDDNTPVKPKTKSSGGKWRIGYFEGGPYTDYYISLKNLVNGLAKLGWLEYADNCFENRQNNRDNWKCLATRIRSNYLEFVPDAYWSADWVESVRKANRDKAIAGLKGKDLDLIIAMGTWAGKDLATPEHGVPVAVTSTTTPVESGIIKSARDSGLDHVFARVDPDRYVRQLRLFHDVVGFKKLGIAYANTPEGRLHAAVDQIEAVAAEKQFEVVPCFLPLGNIDLKTAEQKTVECYDLLSSKTDAIFLSVYWGLTSQSLGKMMPEIIKRKIPSFAMGSTDFVRQGVLMGMGASNREELGEFIAEAIAKIFNGAKPRNLNQVFRDNRVIYVNIKTAKLIGFHFPMDLLSEADRIYREVEPGRVRQE